MARRCHSIGFEANERKRVADSRWLNDPKLRQAEPCKHGCDLVGSAVVELGLSRCSPIVDNVWPSHGTARRRVEGRQQVGDGQATNLGSYGQPRKGGFIKVV